MILFENLIHPQIRLENDNYKYYWKVIIGRRDLIGPIFEIAGFMEEEKANKLYNKQIETGKIIKFCCDFKLIEEKCDQYKV